MVASFFFYRLAKIKQWVDEHDPGALIIPLSCVLETKVADMPDDERQAYLKEQGCTSSLEKIIVNGFRALNLQYFFTCGKDEVKAWTMQVRRWHFFNSFMVCAAYFYHYLYCDAECFISSVHHGQSMIQIVPSSW